MEKEFMSERQMALLLGVAPRTVKLWRDKGLLDSFKIEKRNEKRKNVFYIKEDLLKWHKSKGQRGSVQDSVSASDNS